MIEHQRTDLDEGGEVILVRFQQPHIAGTVEVEDLGDELYRLVEPEVSPRLVLDFSRVEFFSSAALGKLISLLSRVRARQGTLILCNIRPGLMDVFRTCHLDRIFQVCTNVDDALKSSSRIQP
jgi:anti-sigma B factor antagonist